MSNNKQIILNIIDTIINEHDNNERKEYLFQIRSEVGQDNVNTALKMLLKRVQFV